MLHRLSLPQHFHGLTDSAWAYGVGLGTVSAPVILYVMSSFGISGNLNDFGWTAVVCGTLGMSFGGLATYSLQRPRRPIERALLLTMTTPFVALVVASTPFVAFAGLGFFLAMLFGLMLMPLAIIVTACWSALYLSLPAPHRAPIHALRPEAGDRSTGILVVGSLVLLMSAAALLWFTVGSGLGRR